MSFDELNNFKSLIRKQNRDLLGKIKEFKFTKSANAAKEFPLYGSPSDPSDPFTRRVMTFTTPTGITYEVVGRTPIYYGNELRDFERKYEKYAGAHKVRKQLDEEGVVSIITKAMPARDYPGGPVEAEALRIEKEILNDFKNRVVPQYSNLSMDKVAGGVGTYRDQKYLQDHGYDAGAGLEGGIYREGGWSYRYGKDKYPLRVSQSPWP